MTAMTGVAGRPAAEWHLRASMRLSPAHDASPFTAAALNAFLADTAILAAKTQAGQWNTQGPDSLALHELTGAQHAELVGAMDVLAGRIRALGVLAPDGLAQMLAIATLEPRLGTTERKKRHPCPGREPCRHGPPRPRRSGGNATSRRRRIAQEPRGEDSRTRNGGLAAA